MNDVVAALEGAVREACARHSSSERALGTPTVNAGLWASLEQIGITLLSVPEKSGGDGADVTAAVAVLKVLGEYSAQVPFAESAVLAGWLLAAAGFAVPRGPMTAATAGNGLRIRPGHAGVCVEGVIARVPWARCADRLVVLRDRNVLLLRGGEFQVVHQKTNLAGEPRDDVSCNAVLDPALARMLPAESAVTEQAFYQRAALARSALIAGAARRALELSVSYAGEREQFGRAIAKFQSVQQHMAAMAGEVLLATVATESAARALDDGREAGLAIAAAKSVASHCSGVVASLAHQIHGAIGYTDEHPLRHSTTRLWAWRDEFGNEEHWDEILGQSALTAGGDGLWPLVTG